MRKFSEMAGGGAREGSLFVPEELRFNQLGGNCGAIQRDEAIFAARGLLVNRPRHELFASSCLAQDANTRFAGGYAIDLGKQLLHRRA